MDCRNAVAAHWEGDFDDDAFQAWCENLRASLDAPEVSLGLVFVTPPYFKHAEQILEIIRVHGRVPLLAGCSSASLVANDKEIEDSPGIVVALHYLPGAELTAVRFQQDQVDAAYETEEDDYWYQQTGITKDQTNGWLAYADPFHLDAENWLYQWNDAYAPKPIIGGLSSGVYDDQVTQVYLNGDIFEEGGVAISVGGDVMLESIISQGCTPIGETWTITRAESNIIQEIGNRPAYEVLVDTFNDLSPRAQKKAERNLFVGLVIDEYLEDFHRGDFLIRNLMGADPVEGALVVGAFPRLGQTMQFQRRDADAATEDMTDLLNAARQRLEGREVYGGVLHCCNGRGKHLFGTPSHDALTIQRALGPLPLSGFFCNGEIGPVGNRSFLHGYTASLALFVKKSKES